MNDEQDQQLSEADAALQREILRERKFTLAEAIGRLAGPGAMKGESPITRLQQAEIEIASCLRSHLAAELETVLHREVKQSELLLNNPDQPLAVLVRYCQRLLDSHQALQEFVRNVDVEWGRIMGERPRFERDGAPAQPDDPYTVESVRGTLSRFVAQLSAGDDQIPHGTARNRTGS
jgi:hypothetical protein